MRRLVRPQPSYDVEIEVNGKKHAGKYTVARGMLHVWSRYGARATQRGSVPPTELATTLLRELVGAYQAKLH